MTEKLKDWCSGQGQALGIKFSIYDFFPIFHFMNKNAKNLSFYRTAHVKNRSRLNSKLIYFCMP